MEIINLPDDFDLAGRYYKCNDIAFQRLYDRYQNDISSWIYTMAIGPTLQDIEDIRQDVLTKTFYSLKRKQLERSGNFRGWLYKVTRSVVIDWGRREHKNIRIAEEKVFVKRVSIDEEYVDIDRFHIVVTREAHRRDWDTLRGLLEERQITAGAAPVLARHSPGDDSGSGIEVRGGEHIRKAAPQGRLDVVCGDEVKRYVLDEGEWIIGRRNPDIGDIDESSQPDIKLKNEHVSRRHAKIILKKGKSYIEDLGSTNGTTINEKPVTFITELKSGDRIQVGSAVLEFLGAE